MLGGPQRMITGLVHHSRDAARGPEYLREAVIGVAPVIGGGSLKSDIVQVDLADIQDVEAFDHAAFLSLSMAMDLNSLPREAACACPQRALELPGGVT